MTSSAIEFANQLADVRNKLKVKNDAFIAKYLPIIKQGILDAAGSNDSCYEFKIHEHEPNPKYFNHFKEYKKHYNPAQYYDAIKEIAKLLGVADPDIARDIELKLDCPEDNHENSDSDFEYDSDCDDIPDRYFKKMIFYRFYYPKYDASIIDDKCAICLDEFICGQTVMQCSKCKDCIHKTCGKTNGNLKCVYCPSSNNAFYYTLKDSPLIPRTKKD